VAAYARVSSGKDAMIHSLSAQISHYSEYIQSHPGWAYAGVYADEAITGTKDDRAEFQRMLADCRDGKIDVVLTKSISRFSRNTVTLLETVRELKSLGVDVFFERENIHSMSGDGELMLTVLASFAQEESLSTSENCKWRIRNDFKRGIPGNFRIYGYRKKKGDLIIEPKEAEIVRMIFRDYLSGMGRNLIMKKLREMGVKTLHGADFRESQIEAMLCNEKYAGDLLLQKSFVDMHPNKKKRKNRGELDMYLVRDAHEAIVDRETFDKVQAEIKKRSRGRRAKGCTEEVQGRAEESRGSSGEANGGPRVANACTVDSQGCAAGVPSAPQSRITYPFTGLITCGHCGKHFRRKTVASTGREPRIVWICSTYNTLGKRACPSKQIPELILMDTAALVLGLAAFDEAVFTERVVAIRVPAANQLVFVLKDGQEIKGEWADHSRRDSWDDAMRERAQQKAREAALRKSGK
jgi:DNA invertase Pin-like site-specific DNA recombinase